VPPSLQPCAPSELALRDAGRTASGTGPGTVFALRNLGASPCRLNGGVGVRLYGADGKQIPLQFGPNDLVLRTGLTLAPGEEASFTLAFAPPASSDCATAARIEVVLSGRPSAVAAATALAACPGATATISRLRLGLPLTRASLPYA
jgi:hypothetical protein